ncbi:MAG: glycosyltransferase [Phocaeicola sp.]|nr:glycosyltransferase [Phocaeicola sp.]
MKRLLQINVVANSGSTGRIAERIGSLAISNNWESFIAYGRWANKSDSKLIKIGNKFEIILHGINSILFDKHGLSSSIATQKLIKTIIKINPDIIHLHNIHGYYINYKILFEFLKQYNKPIIWTLHDCWAYTGHCVHYTAIGCCKWKVLCNKCPYSYSYPKALVDRSQKNYLEKKKAFTSINNLTIVTVSEWLKNEVKQSFLNKFDIKKIYNGIDTSIFHPCDNNVKVNYNIRDKFLIISVATQWIKNKGLDDFLELSKSLGEKDIIMLIGLTKQQIKKLPQNIIGIPNINNINELINIYSAADLYISFSTEETFGMTIIESMSCGTPVLAYKSTASPELINDKVGKCIQPHDINSACEFINEVKAKGKAFYIESCIHHVKEKFDINKTISQYITLYNTITK